MDLDEFRPLHPQIARMATRQTIRAGDGILVGRVRQAANAASQLNVGKYEQPCSVFMNGDQWLRPVAQRAEARKTT